MIVCIIYWMNWEYCEIREERMFVMKLPCAFVYIKYPSHYRFSISDSFSLSEQAINKQIYQFTWKISWNRQQHQRNIIFGLICIFRIKAPGFDMCVYNSYCAFEHKINWINCLLYWRWYGFYYGTCVKVYFGNNTQNNRTNRTNRQLNWKYVFFALSDSCVGILKYV